ncbi:fimbrial protein [Collimonas pratensis]|nr:fimbrial protein [Collimonas pratensis]
MKKNTLQFALFAIFCAAGAAQASDGTITFSGKLTSVTCGVHGGEAGATGGNFTVVLPPLSTKALASKGAVAGSTGFNIVVGGAEDTGCTDGTKASVHFEATSPLINSASGNLKLTSDSTAANVEVQISDASAGNALINLFTNRTSTPVVIAKNTATLPFTAQYIATGVATPGTVNTNVQYSISFN